MMNSLVQIKDVFVRKLDNDDKKQAHLIWSDSYNFKPEDMGIETEDITNSYGVFSVGGKLLACGDFVPARYCFQGKEIFILEIYRLATSFVERNKGYAKALVGNVLELNEFNMITFAWLKPRNSSIYRNMGFRPALFLEESHFLLNQIFILNKQISTQITGQTVYPTMDFDITEIVEVYKEHCDSFSFTRSRSQDDWKNLVNFVQYTNLAKMIGFRNNQNKLVGYIVLKVKKENKSCLVLTEFVWITYACLNSMFSFLKSLDNQFDNASVSLPVGFPLENFIGCLHKIKTYKKSQGLFRIMNITRALYLLNRPSTGEDAIFLITDSLRSENDGFYIVEWKGNVVVKVEKTQHFSSEIPNKCTVEALTKLILSGYQRSFSEMLVEKDIYFEERIHNSFVPNYNLKIGNS
jgi:predicted acetyltransferase